MSDDSSMESIASRRLSRRHVLTSIGAAAAGAAGAGILTAAPAAAASVASARDATTDRGLALQRANAVAATAGVTYQTVSGQNFKPVADSSGWAYVAFGGISLTTAANQTVARVSLPNGAVITECSFWVTHNDTNTMSVGLWAAATDGSGFQTGSGYSAGTPPQSASVQKVDFAIPTPIVVDNAQYSYDLRCSFGTAGGNQLLHSGRIGYTNNPGLVTFPDARRVLHGDASPFVSGVTYGPFDATQKWDASGATGVPAGAKAAFCAVQSYTPGVLTIYPDGAADPGVASYSGTGTQGAGLNMLYMLVPLSSAGKFKVKAYFSGKAYVDVWGYLI